MEWRSEDQATFQKPIGKTELPFGYVARMGQKQGRENWAVHTVTELGLPPTADLASVFRRAWVALRLDFPDIDARINVETRTKKYTVLDELSLARWADSTFRVERGFASADAMAESLRASQGPTCHVLDHGKGRVSVLINCSHALLDGFGSLHVMNHFLHLAASVSYKTAAPGSEAINLTQNFEEIVGERAPCPEKVVNRVSNRLATYYSSAPFAGFPLDSAPTGVFGDTRILSRVTTKEETRAFVAACKSKGISMTAAVQSALVDVVYSRAPSHARGRKLGMITPVNVRRLVPALQQGDSHAVGIFMGCFHLLASADDGFMNRAKRLGEEYALSREPDWLEHEVAELSVQMTSALAKGMQPRPEPPSTPVLSSLGVVDDVVAHQHGNIEVLGVRVGQQVLTPENRLYAWTFRERFHLSFNFNASYFKDISIECYMNQIFETLSRELGIPLHGTMPSDFDGW